MENIFEIILVVAFGAIFGSYATLFAYRLPRGESCFGRYFGKKSRCPNCGFTLMTRDLIPLLNWIVTCGKCRSCKTKIPRVHLFVELTTTILFLFCYAHFGITEIFIINCLIATAMVIIMACDITHKKFTDQALIFLLFFVTINRVLFEQTLVNIVYSLMIGVVVSVIFYKLIYNKITYLFVNSTQVFDYIKFILIASIALDYQSFLFYFFEIMFILSLFTILKIIGKKNIISIGYVFVFPLLWMMIIQPINY
ncbi:MAG: prepilin peptidase [Proteobacteria bacterium]|nr:prepilin peptidase [Pseudomonadota bacterium]